MHNDVEDILGQFYCAFGQGAGSMRIRRSAIAALRDRYGDPIAANLDSWKKMAPSVLGFVAQVGRTAALFATQEGRTAIDARDFVRARQMVEHRVHETGERSGTLYVGDICPGMKDEQVTEAEPTTTQVEQPAYTAPVTAPARH
jgi:histone H3/H4